MLTPKSLDFSKRKFPNANIPGLRISALLSCTWLKFDSSLAGSCEKQPEMVLEHHSWCLYSVRQEESRKIWSGTWKGRQKTVLEILVELAVLGMICRIRYKTHRSYKEYNQFLLLPYLRFALFGKPPDWPRNWIYYYCSCERDCRGKVRKQTLCRSQKENRGALGEDGKKGFISRICFKIFWLCNRSWEWDSQSAQGFHPRKLLLLIADNTHNILSLPHSSLTQSLSYPVGGGLERDYLWGPFQCKPLCDSMIL